MKLIFVLFFLVSFVFGDSFAIKYKGITLGNIPTLDTLNKNYLQAKVSNPIVKLLLRKKYYVFYDGNKPDIKDAKFRSDNKKIIFALKKAISSRPANENFIIDAKRNITLKCQGKVCDFDYFSNKSHNAHGIIEFDENGKFYKLTETKSTLTIERN